MSVSMKLLTLSVLIAGMLSILSTVLAAMLEVRQSEK